MIDQRCANSKDSAFSTIVKYFPEADVTDYEPLIAAMQNDPKDRHVVAAAVKSGAQVIATSNNHSGKTIVQTPPRSPSSRRSSFCVFYSCCWERS
ncbi:MAG TPA: hypothetical protein VKP30_22555 [Polyangiaceae bacterium]|nr:hypothetical protein [Polyangiaceae bacterium]